MRLALISAGAAGMYCGSCMRDNTLATALIKLGHDAVLIPTFTPITTDEQDLSQRKVFLGGINVYLQEKFWLFRHTPRWVDRMLNARWLLKLAGRFSTNTDYSQLGGLTASMLEGTHGHQRKEVAKLIEFLKNEIKPDVVILTNALLSGIVPAIRAALAVPVITTLQGDDIFLQALPERDRQRCIRLMQKNDEQTSAYISTSWAYADFMSRYLGIERRKIEVVYPGIMQAPAAVLGPQTDRPPTLGYFARIAPEKGFAELVDAFVKLKQLPGTEQIQLRYSGWLGPQHQAYHERQIEKLRQAGLLEQIHRIECPDHASKMAFYQSIDVLSVPAPYAEPKGLYVLEAWSAGVPVVQPAHGSFPELIERTGGGRIVPPGNSDALAGVLRELLLDRTLCRDLGERGRRGIEQDFTAEAMARQVLAVVQKISAAEQPQPQVMSHA